MVGYCTAVTNKAVGQRPLKPLARMVDVEALLSPAMLRLAQWMADYYLCPLGQVLQAIVPAGVRGKAGTREMTFLTVPPDVIEQLAAGALKLGEKQLDALACLGGITTAVDAARAGSSREMHLGADRRAAQKRGW